MAPDETDVLASGGGAKRPARRAMKKCDRCRFQKIKCVPVERDWYKGERCLTCEERDLPCGPNTAVDRSSKATPVPAIILETEDFATTLRLAQSSDTNGHRIAQPSFPANAPNIPLLPKPSRTGQIESGQSQALSPLHPSNSSISPSTISRSIPPAYQLSTVTGSTTVLTEPPPPRPTSPVPPSPKYMPSENLEASQLEGLMGVGSVHSDLTVNSKRSYEEAFDLPPQPNIRGLIWLLRLHAGSGSDPLQGNLIPRNGAEPYEAISYTWGRKFSSTPLTFTRLGVVHKLLPTSNLEAALLTFRRPDSYRTFWVDEICIDQKDLSERVRHLPLISSIFQQAESVCVWLGREDSHTSSVFDFIHSEVTNPAKANQLSINPQNVRQWREFADLLQRPYFSRRWALTELTFGRQAVVHCGSHEIPFSVLADAVVVFDTVRLRQLRLDNMVGMEDISVPEPALVFCTGNNFVQKSDDGLVMQRSMPLVTLLAKLTRFECSIPHDSIYSILSLASDTRNQFFPQAVPQQSHKAPEGKLLPPEAELTPEQKKKVVRPADYWRRVARPVPRHFIDYTRPFSLVCQDFLSFIFGSSESLDIICFRWAPEGCTGLPSWVPTFRSDLQLPPTYGAGQIQADPLVHLPESDWKRYSASGKYRAQFKFSNTAAGSLFASGFILDDIKSKTPPVTSGKIHHSWLEQDLMSLEQRTVPPDNRFWRTLVANRNGDGKPPSRQFKIAYQWVVQHFAPGDDIDMERVVKDAKPLSTELEFIRRVQSVVWMRRLIWTTTGYIGLAPAAAEEGDLICILYGCSVPVLLRKVENRRTGDYHYHVVGETYIDNMMNGEAIT